MLNKNLIMHHHTSKCIFLFKTIVTVALGFHSTNHLITPFPPTHTHSHIQTFNRAPSTPCAYDQTSEHEKANTRETEKFLSFYYVRFVITYDKY